MPNTPFCLLHSGSVPSRIPRLHCKFLHGWGVLDIPGQYLFRYSLLVNSSTFQMNYHTAGALETGGFSCEISHGAFALGPLVSAKAASAVGFQLG